MTEKEFFQQVWRPYDTVTLENGIKARVLNVCFPTRSVRIKLPGDGMPDWFRCELIESHTTQDGKGCDDASIIEDLHKQLLDANDRLEILRAENNHLAEKISKNYLDDILRSLNLIKEGLTTKKSKIEKVERGLAMVEECVSKMNSNE